VGATVPRNNEVLHALPTMPAGGEGTHVGYWLTFLFNSLVLKVYYLSNASRCYACLLTCIPSLLVCYYLVNNQVQDVVSFSPSPVFKAPPMQ
jgi:hypothetical protein